MPLSAGGGVRMFGSPAGDEPLGLLNAGRLTAGLNAQPLVEARLEAGGSADVSAIRRAAQRPEVVRIGVRIFEGDQLLEQRVRVGGLRAEHTGGPQHQALEYLQALSFAECAGEEPYAVFWMNRKGRVAQGLVDPEAIGVLGGFRENLFAEAVHFLAWVSVEPFQVVSQGAAAFAPVIRL